MKRKICLLTVMIDHSLPLAAVALLFADPSDDPSSAFKQSPLPTRLPIGNLLLLLLRKSFLFFLLPKSNVQRTKIALYSTPWILSLSPPPSLSAFVLRVLSSHSVAVGLGIDWKTQTRRRRRRRRRSKRQLQLS
jgi:hypothetical protein